MEASVDEGEEIANPLDWSEDGVWQGRCLDDGTGRNVYFVSKSGKRTRREPVGYVEEKLENGDKKFYYRTICIRCRKIKSPPYLLTKGPGKIAFSYNLCEECMIKTVPSGISRLRGNTNEIYQANLDTPKTIWIDLGRLASAPDRIDKILQRSITARFATLYDAKLARNKERTLIVRRRGMEYGLDPQICKHTSFGFGNEFDEYYGEIDEDKEPHGNGVKFYSDGSIYFGGFEHGLHHTDKRGQWNRPNGSSYDGTWMTNYKHGKGTQVYPEGGQYIGEFAKGYEHGQGKKQYPDGGIFEGRFRFGRRDGPGVMTDKDGKVERGNFRDTTEVYHEKPTPVIIEKTDFDLNEYYNPPTLMDLTIKAVAQAMHLNRRSAPAVKLQRLLPENLKLLLAREFLRTMNPEGTKSFLENGPVYAFTFVPQVEFQNIRITQADCEALMYFQNSNNTLVTLKCTSNHLTLPAIDLICKNLSGRAWPLLCTLDLSFNVFDLTAIQTLCSCVNSIASLKNVRLAACKIKPAGAFVIATMLKSNAYLINLDLSFNVILAMGSDSIAEALTENETLINLNMRCNNIGLSGGRYFCDAMKYNGTLRVLCLADNGVGEEMIALLSARLNGTLGDILASVRVNALTMPTRYIEGRYDSWKPKIPEKYRDKIEDDD